MDIHVSKPWPAASLSNFCQHIFEFRGLTIASMEGLLQGIKQEDIEQQNKIFSFHGMRAKRAGNNNKWKYSQILWWQGQAMKRDSQEYQEFLDEAFEALGQNKDFKRALEVTGSSVITHSVGKTNPSETALTRDEFCGRLTRLREKFKNSSPITYF